MSYQTWHIYGYGICVSDITRCTVERLEKLLALAPNYQKRMHQWFMDCKITKPNLEDYLNYDQNFNLGLATILKDVIRRKKPPAMPGSIQEVLLMPRK